MERWIDLSDIPERARRLPVKVIGGGLAGVEAAYALAKEGVPVELIEMKPRRFSPAHRLVHLAELVCSNSFKSMDPLKASGLLKKELGLLGSVVLEAARKTRVPAGEALAVDRDAFAERVTRILSAHPLIKIVRKEAIAIPRTGIVVVSVGPLPSGRFERAIEHLLGDKGLYFYDAVSPVVESESIDFSKVFRASRYEEGEGDYINCPMSREQYLAFVQALKGAKKVPLKPLDEPRFFQGCQPVDLIAEQGEHALAFAQMSPVGFRQFKGASNRPFAVIQLRQDDLVGCHYAIVGFQSRLKMQEQDRVFRMIPGLENARFVRYGTFHRNTYINTPKYLSRFLSLKHCPRIFFAGQVCGVEGYLESAAMGLVAGLFAARMWKTQPIRELPKGSMIAGLLGYITFEVHKEFKPMYANFGLLEAENPPGRDRKAKRAWLMERSSSGLDAWMREMGIGLQEGFSSLK
jgi:methylenetetrahydrofolate--tRNA-(uracil-5-)-methyltransferase